MDSDIPLWLWNCAALLHYAIMPFGLLEGLYVSSVHLPRGRCRVTYTYGGQEHTLSHALTWTNFCESVAAVE